MIQQQNQESGTAVDIPVLTVQEAIERLRANVKAINVTGQQLAAAQNMHGFAQQELAITNEALARAIHLENVAEEKEAEEMRLEQMFDEEDAKQ